MSKYHSWMYWTISEDLGRKTISKLECWMAYSGIGPLCYLFSDIRREWQAKACEEILQEKERQRKETEEKARQSQRKMRMLSTRELYHFYQDLQKSQKKRSEVYPITTEQVYDLLIIRKLAPRLRQKITRRFDRTEDDKKRKREKRCYRARGRR